MNKSLLPVFLAITAGISLSAYADSEKAVSEIPLFIV